MFIVFLQFVRHHLAPGVCNPIAALTILVELSPMPALLEEVPADLEEIRDERHINQAVIWDITMFLWPSLRVPPYAIPQGWIWVWHREGDHEIWSVLGLR